MERARALRLIGIANVLLAMAREIEKSERPAVDRAEPDNFAEQSLILPDDVFDHPLLGELARQAYRDRRRRNSIFHDEDLFAEPAWDILLDLFVAAKDGRLVSVTSACIGAAVPPTTALRWIAILEEKGLLSRTADSNDARRFNVRLSASGYSAMAQYFSKPGRPIFELGFGDLPEGFKDVLETSE